MPRHFNHFRSSRVTSAEAREIILRQQLRGKFLVRRSSVPGQLDQRVRYFTKGCGWSQDIHKAMAFDSLGDAALHHEGDEIVAADEVLRIPPCRDIREDLSQKPAP